MITEINEQDDAQILDEEVITTTSRNEATVVVEENIDTESQTIEVPTKPAVKTFKDLSMIEVELKSDETLQHSQQEELTVSEEEIPSETETTTEVEESIVDDGKEEITATTCKDDTQDVSGDTDERDADDVDASAPTPTSDEDDVIEDEEEITEQVKELGEYVPEEVDSNEDPEETVLLSDRNGNMVEVPVDKIDEFYRKQALKAKKTQRKKAAIANSTKEEVVEEIKPEVIEQEPVTEQPTVSEPVVQKSNTAPEFVSEVYEDAPRRVYDRDPDLEHIMLMTVKSIKRCLNHVTNVVASTKNNKHFTLKVESSAIQNLFLHGICKSSFYNRDELIQALQEILNHWHENLGVLPENNFTVCFMRLKLGDRMLNAKVSKNSLLRDEEVRQKIYSHYMSTRWEWSYRSILPMLELADNCESKTRFVDGEVKTRICVRGEWTPFLEDMEDYFGVKADPYADVDIPENERLRLVGITLHVLGTNNPRAVGHIVKMNAIRKALLVERAETIKSEKIEIQVDPRRIKTSEVDARGLELTLSSNMPKNTQSN